MKNYLVFINSSHIAVRQKAGCRFAGGLLLTILNQKGDTL